MIEECVGFDFVAAFGLVNVQLCLERFGRFLEQVRSRSNHQIVDSNVFGAQLVASQNREITQTIGQLFCARFIF